MKTSLTIAGFDPTGLAGTASDLATFQTLGIKGISLQTALTAQDGRTVKKVVPLPANLIKKQAALLFNNFTPNSTKIGMLGDSDVALAVIDIIKKYKLKNIVTDTVLKSGGGTPLTKKEALPSLLKLIALSTIVTPNIDEAMIITGEKIKTLSDMEEASILIHNMGCNNALITGGHLAGDPIDVLYDGKKHSHFKGKRIKANKLNLHGTGCILSSAIAGYLALGNSAEKSIELGKKHLEKVIKSR